MQSNLGNRGLRTGVEDLGRAMITPIYKKKRSLTEGCGNYRGIGLLSHTGKVMAIILQRRILKRTEEILSKSQAGFRSGRATTDQILKLRQIAEKYLDKDRSIYCCYIDFQKAFTQSGRGACGRQWSPASTLQPIPECRQSKQRAHRVVQNISWSQTRMCHLPKLFNIHLELLMLMASDDALIGACIQGEQINNLRFADDVVLIAETPEELETLIFLNT